METAPPATRAPGDRELNKDGACLTKPAIVLLYLTEALNPVNLTQRKYDANTNSVLYISKRIDHV